MSIDVYLNMTRAELERLILLLLLEEAIAARLAEFRR